MFPMCFLETLNICFFSSLIFFSPPLFFRFHDVILKVGWFSSAPWWSAACWLTCWSRPAGHDSKPSSELRKPRCGGVKHQGVGCPESTGSTGRKLLGTPEVQIPGVWKDLHDMLAEDDSNVYLVSKSVKENFFKSVETDEFIWKKLWWLMTSHDNLQNSPPVQLTDPFFAIQDRVETAPWFWSWPWLPILQFKVCHVGFFVLFQKLFSGFYMIE